MTIYIVMLPYDDGPPVAAFRSRANAEACASAMFSEALARAKQTDPDDPLSPAWHVRNGATWEDACFTDQAFVEELVVQP